MMAPFPALLSLRKPLIFFDIEATGTDPENDRIIEICLLKVLSDGKKEVFLERINPGIPIPPESTVIHGIRDGDIREKPYFRAVAGRILEFIAEGDLAGYNILRFDVPLLAKEFSKAGLDFSLEGRFLIDMMKIFHRKESRDLSAALRFYCNKELAHAHSAQADTEAVADIFWAQLERYPDLPRDISLLHQYCNSKDERFVDSSGRFAWRYGKAYFNFGKYRGYCLEQISREDRNYLAWLLEEGRLSDEAWSICQRALEGEFPSKTSVNS